MSWSNFRLTCLLIISALPSVSWAASPREGGPNTIINVDQFGAAGDNQHDDTDAFNKALASSHHVICTRGKTYLLAGVVEESTADSVIDFSGCKIRISEKPSTTQFLNIEASGVTVRGLYLTGYGNGIQIGATRNVSNIQILNFTCDSSALPTGLAQCIYWGTVNDLVVDHPVFNSTGYGMLQMPHKPSNRMRITHAIALNMYNDAIEQNGADRGVATDIVIDDFTFNGAHAFPKPATEERFAGFTSVDGLRITNSHVKDANGDACLHIEGPSQHIVLANNSWTDCAVSGGNGGFIYVMTSTADISEINDTFVYTGALLPKGAYAYDTSSKPYHNPMTIRNVTLIDSSGSHSFGGFDLMFHSGPVLIQGARARGLSDFVHILSTSGVTIAQSEIIDTLNGIYSEAPTSNSGSGGEDIRVLGNQMQCSHACIFTGPNKNGSGAPKNWDIRGNSFQGRLVGVNAQQ